jgi:micrococcal nuclease
VRKKTIFVAIAVVVLIVAVYIILSPRASRVTATVARVIDGDTIELSNGDRVRLLGIDAPERGEQFYDAATDRLKELVENEAVGLEKDTSHKDEFDRLLRYVFVDDLFVNMQMIEDGYAYAYVVSPDERYLEEFVAAENRARNNAVNIWRTAVHDNCLTVEFHYNARGNDNDNLNDEYVTFKNSCSSPIDMTGWKVRDEGNNKFYFSQFVLCSGCLAVLHSGSGVDSGNNLYWCSDIAIWNNAGDTLWLHDENSALILRQNYRKK